MKTALKTLAVATLMAGAASTNALAMQSPSEAQDNERKKHKQVHRVVIRDGFGLGGGWLGIQAVSLTPELRRHFGVSEDRGVMVGSVEEDSPAEAGGILVGDILTVVDGEDVESGRSLAAIVRKKKKGDAVAIELMRDGRLEAVTVILDEREGMGLAPGGYGFFSPHGDSLIGPDVDFTFEWNEDTRQAVKDAMGELQDRMKSGEWREKLEVIDSLDLSAIQDRMREVEQRLKELEGELAKAEREKR